MSNDLYKVVTRNCSSCGASCEITIAKSVGGFATSGYMFCKKCCDELAKEIGPGSWYKPGVVKIYDEKDTSA